MALSLVCTCGTRFEVEDTFAGQGISCPECQRPVQAPAGRTPLRTSGLAIASLIVALVLAFTLVGPIVAVLLGILALLGIARHPDRITGSGYAVGGILLGMAFTGLSLFAFSQGELFDEARDKVTGSQVDRTGPPEVIHSAQGYAITRPTPQWGVAKSELMNSMEVHADLMLANKGKGAFIDVTLEEAGFRTLAQWRDEVLKEYRKSATEDLFGNRNPSPSSKDFQIREDHRLAPLDGAEVEEVVLDVRVKGQLYTYVIRLVKDDTRDTLFIVRGWTFARRYSLVQPEIRKGLDSFRLLPGEGPIRHQPRHRINERREEEPDDD